MAKRVSEAAARQLFLNNSLKPLEPFVNTMIPWKSECQICKKIVSPNYNKVRLRGHQCHFCSGHTVDPIDAVALMESRGFKPLATFPGAQKPWKSQCMTCKKIHTPNYTTVKLGHGCKYCARTAVDPIDAETAMLAREFKILEPFPGATKPWKVQCLKCKREFTTVFHSLKTNNRCKYCSGVAVETKDLHKRLSELKLEPLEPFKSSKTPWKCKCLVCGHVVQPTWARILSGRGHCAYCARRRVDIPEALKLLKGLNLKPLVDFPGSNKPWRCICLVCQHEVQPRWGDLQGGQRGCSYCANLNVDPEVASEKMLLVGLRPLVPYPGANIPWQCECVTCGRKVKPRYTTVQQGRGGCRYCAVGGIDYTKPGLVYLMTHSGLGAHKIGISNVVSRRAEDNRIQKHKKKGWKLFKSTQFPTAEEAFFIEQTTLRWLRMDMHMPVFLLREQMPQGGCTETVDASEIDLPTIWTKVLDVVCAIEEKG